MLKITFIASALIALTSHQALTQESFYKGKTIKVVAGTSAGSGNDLQARSVQRYLGRYIPGEPTVVVQNMPAGGGMAATNHIFNVAAKDGTEIGLFNRNTMVLGVIGEPTAKFDLNRFNWIGTPASYSDNAWVFLIRSGLPYSSLKELRAAGATVNVGRVSANNPFMNILEKEFGIKMKSIIGYQAQEMSVAFERREIDGFGNGYQSIAASTPDLLDKKLGHIIVQFGSGERLPWMSEVPTGRELAQGDTAALIEFAEFGLSLGFPFATPPETPADRVAVLRAAFQKVMNDDEYKAEMKKLKLEYSPKLGDELQADIVRMVKTPQNIVQRYKDLISAPSDGGR